MDLRQLGYFVAVAEECHLGRAAERLHLSQPPLTRQIKALEDELGAQLFERTARGMVLTQAGEILLRDARNIFGLVQQATDRVQRAGQGLAGQVEVGVYGSAIFGVVPNVLARFAQANPEVAVSLLHGPAAVQLSALHQGRVLAVFERLLPPDSDLEIELVAKERLWVAMRADHPLAGRDSIPVPLLQGYPLVLGSSPTGPVTATILRLCNQAGFDPHVSAQTSDMVMASLLTAFTTQITVVPASMVNVKFPGVRYAPLDATGSDAHMNVFCYYRRDEASPLLQRLLATVRAFRAESDAAN